VEGGELLVLLLLLAWGNGDGEEPERPAPVKRTPQKGASNTWSEDTMRIFEQQMRSAGVDARVVLLGIAAATAFHPETEVGNRKGLLQVSTEQLDAVGYRGVPFEQLDAPNQIPWIGRVLAFRMAETGGAAPKDVPELASLVSGFSDKQIDAYVRKEAAKRAASAERTTIYQHHKQLLEQVLATR